MKSPVRENCTPGSVRGLSGNWQSYRNPAPCRDWGEGSVNKLLQVFGNLLGTFPVWRMSGIRINLQNGITQRRDQRILFGAREKVFLITPDNQRR